MMVIGIDPGFNGAVSFLHKDVSNKDILTINDLPVKMINDRKQICEVRFADILKHPSIIPYKTLAVIEDVHAMPKQGVVSMFRFGYNAGILLGALACLRIKTVKIKPAVWKSSLGLSSDKKESLAMAKRLFPDNKSDFVLAKHDGRAEAALIAYWARKLLC